MYVNAFFKLNTKNSIFFGLKLELSAFETRYGDQFEISTYLIKRKMYIYIYICIFISSTDEAPH